MYATDLIDCAAPDILARFADADLRRLFAPHRDVLRTHGFPWPETGGMDRDALGRVILAAGEHLPAALVDGLATVISLGVPAHTAALAAIAQSCGIPIDDPALDALGLAVRLWCERPKALAAFEAEQALPQVRKFVCWRLPQAPPPLHPDHPAIATFAQTMESWLVENYHGTGSACLAVVREGALWISVRHGATLQRIAVHRDGQVDSLVIRPAVHDIVRIDPTSGMVAVHVHGDRVHLTDCYQAALGTLLTGSPTGITSAPLYSMDPLTHGAAALSCADIPELSRATCVEVTLLDVPRRGTRLMLRSSDVLPDLAGLGIDLRSARAVQARFRLRWRDGRSRLVTVAPPRTCQLPHDADGRVIAAWLAARGFLITPLETSDVCAAVA